MDSFHLVYFSITTSLDHKSQRSACVHVNYLTTNNTTQVYSFSFLRLIQCVQKRVCYVVIYAATI